MSRIRRFASAVASGYVVMGSNIVYAMVSVPLALHYLSRGQFGLWALVSQVAAYFSLFDLGVSSAAYRVLIDHKDEKESGEYGATLTTSAIVFGMQGGVIAILGIFVSPYLANVLNIPQSDRATFNALIGWQAVITATSFALRAFVLPLQSHQRFDIVNWLLAGQSLLVLGLLWVGFSLGFGVYSLVLAGGIGVVVQMLVGITITLRLKLLPRSGSWGYPRMDLFKELLSFGNDLFLLGIGWQFVCTTPTIIIGRMLGLEAAAAWSVGTKGLALGQQLVWRLMDYSGPALAEMYVRSELDRLRTRFRDILALSGSLAVALGFIVATGNASFVGLWTHNQISWSPWNDIWLSLWLVITAITRCLNLWVGATKEIGGVKYIYLLQGMSQLAAMMWAVPRYGMGAVIISAAITDALFAGGYGALRSQRFFRVSFMDLISKWLCPMWRFAAVTIPLGVAIWNLMRWPLSPLQAVALLIGTSCSAVLGFWLFGIDPNLRREFRERFRGRSI